MENEKTRGDEERGKEFEHVWDGLRQGPRYLEGLYEVS